TFHSHASDINADISKILEDSDGTIWFTSVSDGIFYLTQEQKIGHLTQNPAQPSSITSNSIYDIIEDANGVLWVGTFNGLNKWNMAHKRFDLLRVTEDKSRSLIGPNITAIDSFEEYIFIATTDGLSIFNTKTGLTDNIMSIEGEPSLSQDTVMSLEVVSESEVWLGYRSKGASKYNMLTGAFEHFTPARGTAGKLQSGAITSILQTKNGTLWLATYGGGLHKYDRKTKTFLQYSSEEDDDFSLSSNRLISITEDQTGLLWLGTFDNGVNVLNPSTNSVYRLGDKTNENAITHSRTAWVIHEDNLGNIWFGTQGEGLNYIRNEDYERGIFSINSITRADGLPSNVVFGILEDDRGRLWISTNRGMAKLTITTGEMVTYTEAHGLLSREFNSGAYHRASDGKLYFGGPIGVTTFYPESIKPSNYSPPIDITNIQILNNFYSVSELKNEHGVLQFGYEDYLIGFEFASLDYVSPNENKYKYKLEGFDADWVQAIDTRRATYTNLPPGAYEFTVMATNSDGVWNELGQSIGIAVQPPPWRSSWAYIIYSCLIGITTVMGFVYISNKSDSQRRYRQKLEEEVSQRTEQLQQANEKLLHASITDQLTGLKNRRYLIDAMPDLLDGLMKKLAFSTETGILSNTMGPRLFFLTFDMDGFKSINDTYGHDAGDQVIVQVGNILKQLTRELDIVTRWGGDEFLIVGERDDINETKLLAEKIRAAIADHPFDIGEPKPGRLTSSLGFSVYPFCVQAPDAMSWQQVHLLADKTLYKSKEAGRNTWTGVIRTNTIVTSEVIDTVNSSIDDAIDEGYVTLMRYEPQIFKSSSISV
ncbi:MAG: diguanylate cyclase, partial [Pseudomonadota bacterium]